MLAAKPPGPRPDPWRRTSGIHRVHSRRGLAIVRELWEERDKIARRRDLSPGRVLPDTAIVEAARSLPGSPQADLTDLPGFQGRGARRHASAWLRAVQRVRGQADAEPAGPGDAAAGRARRRPTAGRSGTRRGAAARRGAHGGGGAGRRAHGPRGELAPAGRGAAARLAAAGAGRPGRGGRTDLAAHGARPWQVELTALPISRALARLAEKAETGEAQAADS